MTDTDTVQKRQVAKKVQIKDLTSGRYIVEEGWKPNYIISRFGKVSRANIMASIVAVSERAMTIDDGSGNMTLRWFEENPHFSAFQAGALINVIGRPREFSGTIYIVPEVIKKIADPAWIELRKKELELQPLEEVEVPPEPPKKEVFAEEKIEEEKETPVDKIIQIIRELDEGDGADTEEVITKSAVGDADSLIKKLMEEGDIFEIKPGKLKVLE